MLITAAFLVLKPTKSKALIDSIISCQPHMSTKALTRDNIMHGFFEAGYVDKVKFRFPDFNKTLSTCRTDPTLLEYNMCKNSFNHLMELCVKYGHIEDSRDPVGNYIRRDAGITQESRQRAQTLTHAHQCELRKAVKDTIELELQRQAKEKEDNIRDNIKNE